MQAATIDRDQSRAGSAGLESLDVYLRELRRHPLLTPDEEHDLATRYRRTRNPALARKLATAHLRLVVRIARDYRIGWQQLPDLIQEGNLGLLQAIDRFDPERGVKLATYAAWWIRAYMLRFLVGNRSLVKIGTTRAQRTLFFGLHREKRKLEARGLAADAKALAQRLGVTEEEVRQVEQRLAAPELSLDEPVDSADAFGRTRMDLLAADPEEQPDALVEEDELINKLRAELCAFDAGLERRERMLLRRRWLSEQPTVLRDLGKRFGVSHERVRQLERRMFGRLRTQLEGSGLR
jgi:RNA polymerase sigma-32 factor